MMDLALLHIVVELDDGGLLTAVFSWVEVRMTDGETTLRVEAQPWVRYDRVSLN